jgi:nitrite reductase/ring-hydroxylating ferredoxin subunit
MEELFVICRAVEVQEEEVRGFTLARMVEERLEPWRLMIARKGGSFYAFENVCPHAGSRLDTVPGEFMDEEGNFIRCGKHGAMFDLDTGKCFIGPCQGEALTPIRLILDDGDLCILDDGGLTDEDGMHIEDPGAHPEVLITPD